MPAALMSSTDRHIITMRVSCAAPGVYSVVFMQSPTTRTPVLLLPPSDVCAQCVCACGWVFLCQHTQTHSAVGTLYIHHTHNCQSRHLLRFAAYERIKLRVITSPQPTRTATGTHPTS